MAHDGKLQQAVTNQRLCFRLAKHASSEPILISYLVAVASQAIALHGMDRILALSTQHPQIAASIKIAIHSDYQTISPSYALQGETAIFARLMEYTQHMGPVAFANTGRKSGEALRTPKPKALFDEWLDVNGRSTIHQLRELSSNAKLPGKSIYEAIDNQLARLKAYPADDYTLARALSPEFTTSIQHRYLMTATAQSTVIAADVLIWSAQHHRFPSTLAQTTDRVPIDPYSGKPFQYASSSNGFVIWSLGQSGQYNPQQAGLMKDTTAIVFRYP
ncbi:hypothetical protein CCAX7_39330 [Capsulimonas corticalis]|uniref:Uncharacterized protein n=2 Tax=Capsulimonas corticalis TaxID=2219043 RepID=A0A9N7L5Q8_9BACT|nr:hypothetical protein CCAX7_39330 [Capsulimonas corticalis]